MVGQYYPFETPTAITICQLDTTQTPPTPALDTVTQFPRCFVVPSAVSEASTNFLLSQTAGTNSDGSTAYRYSSWWDYIAKFFIGQFVMPMLDQFPPPGVAQAKAAAAAVAVDSAKAAILLGAMQ